MAEMAEMAEKRDIKYERCMSSEMAGRVLAEIWREYGGNGGNGGNGGKDGQKRANFFVVLVVVMLLH
ncbi:MAG: hypothetical protein OXF54_11135 [Caldilineaceae bacterium]|nr:hypothetical protein [Caldilineaceae bacterium]